KSGKAYLFEAALSNGDKVDTFAFRVAVKNTPFSLVVLVLASELFGNMAPWHLPLAMGVLAIILLAGTAIIFRINTQNLVLCARLEESSKREQEIEEKRCLLEKEIVERKRAEEALKESYKELKAAQEQLVRHEKLAALGQLAGGVGHELRNPLGVISNAIYFLQMTLSEADGTTREYLEMISSEVSNADKIISDLLDFSRVKAVEREETSVSGLVSKVLEKQPTPENVEVTIAIPPDLPAVFVDSVMIGQVLSNLVTNACQAMPEGGKLTISAQAEK
ncbi:MAG: hypothetical protein KKB35_03115, partial [Proteobacteria bacterium]|nr:hypothetical protein [Pseudomonadota bacterium]